HICHTSSVDAPRLRRHLLKQHSISVPGTATGKRKYDTEEFTYVKCLGKRENSSTEKQHACPSCFSHFPSMADFQEHVK
ncbi:hypothetical protein BY458DRAFT_427510, partial [Sporodiniella umbellata]